MNATGAAFLTLFVLVVAAAIGWVLFTRVRASRLGLPPPPLASYLPFYRSTATSPFDAQRSPGVVGRIKDGLRALRNKRSAAGAYEQTAGPPGGGARRGFGPLDPDEAWDARVGDTYGPGGHHYEERGPGPGPGPGPYGDTTYTGSSYALNVATEVPARRDGEPITRGRSASRNAPPGAANPFDDDAADPSDISLRGVSPRPIDTSARGREAERKDRDGESPMRRSIFREDV